MTETFDTYDDHSWVKISLTLLKDSWNDDDLSLSVDGADIYR